MDADTHIVLPKNNINSKQGIKKGRKMYIEILNKKYNHTDFVDVNSIPNITQSKTGWPKTDWSKYEIKKLGKKECSEFLAKYHYLSKAGAGFRSGFNFGLFLNGELIGVAIFHTISARETLIGCFGLDGTDQRGFYELGRLAMSDAHRVKNDTSWFLMRCVKMLRKETNVRALLSYADDLMHRGYIYQATNWEYYGLTDKKADFWILQEDGTYKKQSRGSTKGKAGEWRPRPRKHRYLMVFDKTLKVL